MKIDIRKFGEILTSRTEGREAYLVARDATRVQALRQSDGRCLPPDY